MTGQARGVTVTLRLPSAAGVERRVGALLKAARFPGPIHWRTLVAAVRTMPAGERAAALILAAAAAYVALAALARVAGGPVRLAVAAALVAASWSSCTADRACSKRRRSGIAAVPPFVDERVISAAR